MSFINLITGLQVAVLFGGVIFISIVVFALSKLFAKQRQEFPQLLKRVLFGALSGFIVLFIVACLIFPEWSENLNDEEEKAILRWVLGWRYVLLFVPLFIGFVCAVFPIWRSNNKQK